MKRHGTDTRTSKEARRAGAWWAPLLASGAALACAASCGQGAEPHDARAWSIEALAPYPGPCQTWFEGSGFDEPFLHFEATYDSRWRPVFERTRGPNAPERSRFERFTYNDAGVVIDYDLDEDGDGVVDRHMRCVAEDTLGRCTRQRRSFGELGEEGSTEIEVEYDAADGSITRRSESYQYGSTARVTRHTTYRGGLIVEESWNGPDERRRTTYTHDEAGRETSKREWLGLPNEEVLSRSWVRTYTPSGAPNTVAVESTGIDGPAHSFLDRHTYDLQDRPTEVTRAYSLGDGDGLHVIWVYDADGVTTRDTYRDEEKERVITHANAEGFIEQEEIDHGIDGTIDERLRFDSAGRTLAHEISSFGVMGVAFSESNTYDSGGRLTGRVVTRGEDTTYNTLTYNWRGNLLRHDRTFDDSTTTLRHDYGCFVGEDPR